MSGMAWRTRPRPFEWRVDVIECRSEQSSPGAYLDRSATRSRQAGFSGIHLPAKAKEDTMQQAKTWRRLAGLTVQVSLGGFMALLGGLIIATTWARLVCVPLPTGVDGVVPYEVFEYVPRPEAVEPTVPFEVCGDLMIIGVGQLVIGLLLMTPSTSSAGALLASSFWGGAICVRMTHREPFLLQSVLLVLSWIGAYLHNPTKRGCFSGCRRKTEASCIGHGAAESPCALER